MSSTINRRKAALAAGAAVATAAAGLLLAAPAGAIDPSLDPDNRLGDLILDIQSGAIVTLGGPQVVSTEIGCPEGYRGSSRVLLIRADGSWDPIRFPGVVKIAADPGTGLDGEPIVRLGSSASRWITANYARSMFEGYDGVGTYIVTCDPGEAPNGSYPTAADGVGTSKYFSIDIDFQFGDGSDPTWAVVPAGAAATDDSKSDINVVVPKVEEPPEPPTGLKISVKPGATTLTGPATRLEDQVWTATGTLDDVTVNDDRQDAGASAWTLNGKASPFLETNGMTPIAATNLGWTPNKVSGAGTAGAAVAVGVGLATDKPLATGTASDTANVETTVNAALTLDVPAASEDGSYKSTLTLTLI
ncbi:MAG: hypothetical protein LBD77_11980 [Bifidobacteriaceae bacterium]|jgi:hypothetical protein|nr:hypothetical protein [Bifidobacteriaceae bacterium]